METVNPKFVFIYVMNTEKDICKNACNNNYNNKIVKNSIIVEPQLEPLTLVLSHAQTVEFQEHLACNKTTKFVFHVSTAFPYVVYLKDSYDLL